MATDFTFQMLIWNHAMLGERSFDAMVAETRRFFPVEGPWDFTRHDLNAAKVDRGSGWEPVPDWWALRHLPMRTREALMAAHRVGGAA